MPRVSGASGSFTPHLDTDAFTTRPEAGGEEKKDYRVMVQMFEHVDCDPS